MKLTGVYCCGCDGDCMNLGYVEFYGYCADCWKDLESEERAVLKGPDVPVKEIVHHKHVVTHYPPPPPRWHKVLDLSWRAVVTAALCVVAWQKWRGR